MKTRILILLSLFASTAFASESRSYLNLPSDTSVLETRFGVQNQNSGNVKASQYFMAERYLQYFDLNGHTSAFYVMTPYFDTRMDVGPKTFKNKGVGDTIFAFAYGITGMNAYSKEEFKKANHNGLNSVCGIFVTAPTGEYDSKAALNAGNNRWQYKGECNVGYRNGPTVHELNVGAFHYGSNDEYQQSKKLEQKPMYFAEIHSSRNLSPQLWVGGDLYYQQGAERTINHVAQKDDIRTLSLGVSAGYRLAANQGLRFSYQKSVDKLKHTPHNDSTTVLYSYLF